MSANPTSTNGACVHLRLRLEASARRQSPLGALPFDLDGPSATSALLNVAAGQMVEAIQAALPKTYGGGVQSVVVPQAMAVLQLRAPDGAYIVGTALPLDLGPDFEAHQPDAPEVPPSKVVIVNAGLEFALRRLKFANSVRFHGQSYGLLVAGLALHFQVRGPDGGLAESLCKVAYITPNLRPARHH